MVANSKEEENRQTNENSKICDTLLKDVPKVLQIFVYICIPANYIFQFTKSHTDPKNHHIKKNVNAF